MAGRPLRQHEKETLAVLVKLVEAATDFLRAYERQVLGAGGAAALAKSGGWFSAKPPGFTGEHQRNFGLIYLTTAGGWFTSPRNSASH